MLAAQRYYVVGLAVFIVVVSFSFFLYRQDEPMVNEKVVKTPYRSSEPTLRDTITSLFKSIKVPPNAPGYRDPSGQYYLGGKDTTWKKPLGKKVLIVDIDTRVPTGENQILNPDTIDWEHLDMSGGGLVSNAIINHYLYAMIHGYDYKFYQARHMQDHHDTWIMPHVFYELVPDYQFVVAMDADVTISHLDVPLEWMFNRWGIKNHTSMALPWDTEEFRNNQSISTDSKGLRVLNTGFVVAQNSNTTLDMLSAWRDCTTESRYPDCARWKYEWSHEQRAFSEYIRYDFNNTPETIVSIPCDDAMGWPGFKKDVESGNQGISDCNGNFIRHYTLGKAQVKNAGASSVMQALSDVLQKSLLRGQQEMWYREPEQGTKKPVPTVRPEPNGDDEEQGDGEAQQAEVRKGKNGDAEKEKEGEEDEDKDKPVPAIIEGMVTVTDER